MHVVGKHRVAECSPTSHPVASNFSATADGQLHSMIGVKEGGGHVWLGLGLHQIYRARPLRPHATAVWRDRVVDGSGPSMKNHPPRPSCALIIWLRSTGPGTGLMTE